MNSQNNNNTYIPPVQINPPPTPQNSESRLAEKAKAVQISTLEVPVVIQRQSVFNRITKNDVWPKTWAEHNVRKLIDSTMADKAVAHTPRDLAKKSYGEQNGSPFTRIITDAPPPKNFSLPEFNIYNG